MIPSIATMWFVHYWSNLSPIQPPKPPSMVEPPESMATCIIGLFLAFFGTWIQPLQAKNLTDCCLFVIT
jgi:hypothetical protein